VGGQFPAAALCAAVLSADAIGCPGAGHWLNAHAGASAQGIPARAASLPHPKHQRRHQLEPYLRVKILVSLGCFGIAWSENGSVWGWGL